MGPMTALGAALAIGAFLLAGAIWCQLLCMGLSLWVAAKLSFSEMHGVGQRSQIVPREIHLSVQLTAENSATRVKFRYEILSPMGAGMVRKLIAKNQEDFRAHVEVNKIR